MGIIHRGVKPVPCYNRIHAINDHVIMRLQCISNTNVQMYSVSQIQMYIKSY